MTISLETLKSLSVEDLAKLKDDLTQLENSKQQDVIKSFISDMEDIGVTYNSIKDKTVSELLNSTKGKKPALYINPDNGKEWSGFGREPKWLTDFIAAGRSKEEFLIKK